MLRIGKTVEKRAKLLCASDYQLTTEMARVAKENPKARTALLPLIRQATEMMVEEVEAFRNVKAADDEGLTVAKWASMSVIEKFAAVNKVAHLPALRSLGLNRASVAEGLGFMAYHIEAEANKSKFYEGFIVEQDGGFRVIRRWGALTNVPNNASCSGAGRVDGCKFDSDDRFFFPTLEAAKRNLKIHYLTRLKNGYTDAFGPKHQTPDGKMLPKGEYPIGLKREVGFGWGTQSVTQCIPALREFGKLLAIAIEETVGEKKPSDVIMVSLLNAERVLGEVAHSDSSMAQKLLALIGVSKRRLSGSPRFLPDPESVALSKELMTVKRYVEKQLSLCTD
jgi:hypothetical protein